MHHQESIVDTIREKFEKSGFDVRCAVDGLEALFTARYERFALIVTGQDIPKVTGFELVRTMRNEFANAETPVIFIATGNENP